MWFRDLVSEAFALLEKTLVKDHLTGGFWQGYRPGPADVFLDAQVFNNRGFDVDMLPCPTISRLFDLCAELPEFDDGLDGI